MMHVSAFGYPVYRHPPAAPPYPPNHPTPTRPPAALQPVQEVVGAEDAPSCMRLVLNDAATYDAATKTGGFDGSIVTP